MEETHVAPTAFWGLYTRNIGTVLFSFATIVCLNALTPLVFFESRRMIIFTKGGWLVFVAAFGVVLALIIAFQFRFQQPVGKASAMLAAGRHVDEGLWQHARRRLLNLPAILAMINLAMFIILPVPTILTIHLIIDMSLETGIFIFFRAVMMGLIAAGLSFFLVEDYLRRSLIPLFFPEGRLFRIPGVLKVPVIRRIRLLNLAGTLNPMIILLITLLFIYWEVGNRSITAVELAKEILMFSLLLCAVFIVIAMRLNFLVSRSITVPIERMLSVVDHIRRGDFSQRIEVLSNDEIGVLGDEGNDMITGLAERERIKDAFGKIATPEIRDQILSQQIPVDGERVTATLLFSDLRNFTAFVENHPPEEVIRSMRQYFTAMQRAIRRYHGLVLQYVGDEIEAAFGVPVAVSTHAADAVRAALAMQKQLRTLNQQRASAGKPTFNHGIGILTGEVLAGLTGSQDRQSYTLTGDTVNLASRIQELTKRFACDILLGEETAKQLDGAFQLEREPAVSIKGYSKPITVYRLGNL